MRNTTINSWFACFITTLLLSMALALGITIGRATSPANDLALPERSTVQNRALESLEFRTKWWWYTGVHEFIARREAEREIWERAHGTALEGGES